MDNLWITLDTSMSEVPTKVMEINGEGSVLMVTDHRGVALIYIPDVKVKISEAGTARLVASRLVTY